MTDILKNVSRETLSKLETYRDILLTWQKRINLIGDEGGDVWQRHFVDSAQLINFLPDKNISLLDMGSGAGFPGLVLAMLGVREVHLAESDTRKTVFLQEVARKTKTVPRIHRSRVEQLHGYAFDVVTSRALAPLALLLDYAAPRMKPHAFCLFPKGKNWSIEVDDARRRWEFDLETAPSATCGESVVLTLRNLRKRHGGE